jgi:predicted TIM-barrel fold metal-dependent hydrolase
VVRVFDLECNLPSEAHEGLAARQRTALGPVTPNRTEPLPGYGLANYGTIFPSRRPATEDHPAENIGLDELVRRLHAAGVEKAVLADPSTPNSVIAQAVQSYPDTFIGLAYVSPYDGMRELERLVREEGLRGLMVSALTDVLPASDRRYYPLYARCVDLGVPVRIYASMNYANDRGYDLGHPRNLDQVAVDFPELTIIAGLSGWPWVNDTVALARRHPNLYCDTAAHRPRYFGVRGSGWEQFLQFGNTLLQDKVMVGLSWGLLGDSFENLIGEYVALPLKERVKEKWLYENAARVFGIDGA